jgi:LemA protein
MALRRAVLRGHSQTRAYEVFRFRRRAAWKGLAFGLAGLALILAGALALAFIVGLRPGDVRFWYVLIGGPALLAVPAGFVLRHRTRRLDEVHRQFQQAPSLPARLLRDHDDAWVEGRVRCPRPRRPPHHSHRCVWFHIVVEERRSGTDGDGWVKVLDQTRHARFWITDATREVEVHLHRASIDYPMVTQRESGNRRFRLRRLPASGRLSACGVARYVKDVRRKREERPEIQWPEPAKSRAIEARSPADPAQDLLEGDALKAWQSRHQASQVREEKRAVKLVRRSRRRHLRETRKRRSKGTAARFRARKLIRKREPASDWHLHSVDEAHGVPADRRLILTAHRHVPLLVTPLRREQWHDRAEADELTTGIAGDVALAYGIPALVWSLGCVLRWWGVALLPGVPIGLLVMLAVLLPSKIVGRYNRFVIYRRRIPNARAYLDADLKMRADLLPQLEKAVRMFAAHEQDVLAPFAELRKIASAGDDVSDSLRALREDYPGLKTERNFERLYADILALEEKIAFGRALLRDSITEYNDTVQSFPSSVLASMTGFEPEPLP